MRETSPPKAVLSVSVDEKLGVDISFGGSEELLVGMLGAMEYAKGWVSERIRARMCLRQDWSDEKPLRTTAPPAYTPEQKVPRDAAVSAYRYAIDALILRIEAIEKMPKEAEFAIDPHLLAQL